MLRFAASTKFDMNVNDLRIAIFNYIVSKQLNENLTLRIDDINKEKNIEDKDKEIYEFLSLFSIDYSNAVHQSDFLKYHQKMAMQLLTQKKAFSCFCGEDKLKELKHYDGFCETLSDETILEVNAPFTVRIKKPKKSIIFTDVLKGNIEEEILDVDSFIILNHNKTPTYNYACAIDDMLMDISFVIRDEKYLHDTAKQIHIRNSLGYPSELKYAHIPCIENASNYSLKSFIDDGFLPSAIANYLVLLGNKTPQEIFTLEEAIKWFKIEDISDKSVKFDIDKLRLINKKHLEIMDDMRLSKILGFADTDIGKLGKLYLDQVSTINELKEKISLIFTTKEVYKDFEVEFLKIKESLMIAPFYNNFDELEEYITKETQLKGEVLNKVLKYILTGSLNAPDLSKIYPLIKNYLGEIIK